MALEDDRLRLLFEQYDQGPEWGRQSRLAKAFDLHPSTVNKIMSGGRGAGEAARDKVCAALDLDPNFFKVADLGERPRYTQWIRKRVPAKQYAPMIAKFFGVHPELLRFRDIVAAELQGRRGEITMKMVIKAVGDLEAEEREAKLSVSSE